MARTNDGLTARGLVSVISATILVAVQAFTVAVAAGWALAACSSSAILANTP